MGGRVTHVKNRDVAYVKYRVPRGEISVFVYEDNGEGESVRFWSRSAGNQRVVIKSARGYSLARWRDSGVVYSVVTDLPVSELNRILEVQAFRP